MAVLARIFIQLRALRGLIVQLRPHLIATNGQCVAVVQASAPTPTHGLTAAVDVGSATAIDQAKTTFQIPHLGVPRDGACAMR